MQRAVQGKAPGELPAGRLVALTSVAAVPLAKPLLKALCRLLRTESVTGVSPDPRNCQSDCAQPIKTQQRMTDQAGQLGTAAVRQHYQCSSHSQLQHRASRCPYSALRQATHLDVEGLGGNILRRGHEGHPVEDVLRGCWRTRWLTLLLCRCRHRYWGRH